MRLKSILKPKDDQHTAVFYNLEAVALYHLLKQPSTAAIIHGLGTNYKDSSIELFYLGNHMHWTLHDLGRSKGKNLLKRNDLPTVFVADQIKGKIYLEGFIATSHGKYFKGRLDAIRSQFFKTSGAYYKAILPVKSNFHFYHTIQNSFSHVDDRYDTTLGTVINLEDETLELLIYNDQNDERFLIIQSKLKQPLINFNEKLHKVTVAIGYLTGYYPGGECCLFSYTSGKLNKISGFKYNNRRHVVSNIHPPTTSNPYSWISNRRIANSYYKKKRLQALTIAIVSRLCQLMLEDEQFFTVILLMIDSAATSILVRPIAYAVALESLKDIITSKNDKPENPITDTRVAKKFRSELLKVLDTYCDQDSFKDVDTLRKKIENINAPTNTDKLSVPFRMLNISLTESDLKMIGSRNDFLHGRIADYKGIGSNRTVHQEDNDLYYASLRFYTLLNMLILKYCGYAGYVINYPKIHEKLTGYPIKEEPFLKV